MRKLLIFSFLAATSLTVAAQNRDTQQQPQQPPEQPPQQQAPDDALKARIRVDGAAGGTAPVPEEARKGVGAGAKPHLHDERLPLGLHRRVPDPVIEPPK